MAGWPAWLNSCLIPHSIQGRAQSTFFIAGPQPSSHCHHSLPETVLTPLLSVLTCIGRTKSYSPDTVCRACLNKLAVTGVQQHPHHFLRAGLCLCELVVIAFFHNAALVLIPFGPVETLSLPSKSLVLSGHSSLHHLLRSFFIAEELSFLYHHPHFSREVGHAVDFKCALVPLRHKPIGLLKLAPEVYWP